MSYKLTKQKQNRLSVSRMKIVLYMLAKKNTWRSLKRNKSKFESNNVDLKNSQLTKLRVNIENVFWPMHKND